MAGDEGGSIQVASWSHSPELAYSGSAWAVGGGKAGRVYATQQTRSLLVRAHMCSRYLLVGDPMSGGARAAESAEAKR